eukprot:5685509-Ditylum_brightwellii.AAC.1
MGKISFTEHFHEKGLTYYKNQTMKEGTKDHPYDIKARLVALGEGCRLLQIIKDNTKMFADHPDTIKTGPQLNIFCTRPGPVVSGLLRVRLF